MHVIPLVDNIVKGQSIWYSNMGEQNSDGMLYTKQDECVPFVSFNIQRPLVILARFARFFFHRLTSILVHYIQHIAMRYNPPKNKTKKEKKTLPCWSWEEFSPLKIHTGSLHSCQMIIIYLRVHWCTWPISFCISLIRVFLFVYLLFFLFLVVLGFFFLHFCLMFCFVFWGRVSGY